MYYGLAGLLFCAVSLAVPALGQQQAGPMTPAAGSPQQQSAPQSTPAEKPPAPPAIPQLTKRPQAPATGSGEQHPGPRVTVPTGTHIPLVLHNAVSTRSARPGDPVYFETLFPVMVDGKVAIPAGSYVSGEVTDAKRPGRVKGRAELMIKLNTLILPNAYMINLNAAPSNAGTGGGETVNNEGKVIGDSDKASDAGTVVKDTAAGAGIGAIAGRGAQGAGIGAGIGAVAGLATVLLSRGPEAELPRGTTVEVVLNRPILLDADKDQFTGPGQASTLPGPPNREPQRSKYPF